MYVTPAGQTDEILVELSQDYRRFPAVDLDVGPVLDPRDALANKLCALYDRGADRDYIDVHRALESGVVGSWADAIELADQQSATPPPRDYVRQGSERAKDLDAGELARYGLSDSDVADLRRNFDKGVATVEEQMGQRRATFIERMAKDSARPAVAPPGLDIQHRGPHL